MKLFVPCHVDRGTKGSKRGSQHGDGKFLAPNHRAANDFRPGEVVGTWCEKNSHYFHREWSSTQFRRGL